MRARFLATLIVAGALLAPGAAPATHGLYGQCYANAVTGAGPTSCTGTFLVGQDRLNRTPHLSSLETHGNFHATIAQGTVTVQWFDAVGMLVSQFTCDGVGLHANVPTWLVPVNFTVGLADATHRTPNCREDVPEAMIYAYGKHTVIVTASATMCQTQDVFNRTLCPFHGAVALSSIA